VAAGVQPLDKLPAISRDRLPSSVRPNGGTPNGINRLYDEETIKAMARERLERCPEQRPTTTPSYAGARQPVQARPKGPVTFGNIKPLDRERDDAPRAPVPAPSRVRFGR
jgi:hypothetical protein